MILKQGFYFEDISSALKSSAQLIKFHRMTICHKVKDIKTFSRLNLDSVDRF